LCVYTATVAVRMDDDSCVMKYIEIVPLDDYSLSTDVKFSPRRVKVCR